MIPDCNPTLFDGFVKKNLVCFAHNWSSSRVVQEPVQLDYSTKVAGISRGCRNSEALYYR